MLEFEGVEGENKVYYWGTDISLLKENKKGEIFEQNQINLKQENNEKFSMSLNNKKFEKLEREGIQGKLSGMERSRGDKSGGQEMNYKNVVERKLEDDGKSKQSGKIGGNLSSDKIAEINKAFDNLLVNSSTGTGTSAETFGGTSSDNIFKSTLSELDVGNGSVHNQGVMNRQPSDDEVNLKDLATPNINLKFGDKGKHFPEVKPMESFQKLNSPRRHSTLQFSQQNEIVSDNKTYGRPRNASSDNKESEKVDMDAFSFNTNSESVDTDLNLNSNPMQSTVFACPPGFNRSRFNLNSRSYGSVDAILSNNRLDPINEDYASNFHDYPMAAEPNRRRVMMGSNVTDFDYVDRMTSGIDFGASNDDMVYQMNSIQNQNTRGHRSGSDDMVFSKLNFSWKNFRSSSAEENGNQVILHNVSGYQSPNLENGARKLYRIPQENRAGSMQIPPSVNRYNELSQLRDESDMDDFFKYSSRRNSTPPRHVNNLAGIPSQFNLSQQPQSPHGSRASHAGSLSRHSVISSRADHAPSFYAKQDATGENFAQEGFSSQTHNSFAGNKYSNVDYPFSSFQQGPGLYERQQFAEPSTFGNGHMMMQNPNAMQHLGNLNHQPQDPRFYMRQHHSADQYAGPLANQQQLAFQGQFARNLNQMSPRRLQHSIPSQSGGFNGLDQGLLQFNNFLEPGISGVAPRMRTNRAGTVNSTLVPGNGQMCESLLEYRATGKRPSMESLIGNVVEYSKDSHGSRFIQFKMETATDAERKILIEEVLTEAVNLAAHPFGNYVIQNFLLHASGEQRFALAAAFKGQMVRLSTQAHGCRVVQYALDIVSIPQRNVLMKEIVQNIYVVSKNNHGTHVVQKCMNYLLHETLEIDPEKRLELDIDCGKHGAPTSLDLLHAVEKAVVADMLKLSVHPHSYRLVQQTLANCDVNRSSSIAAIMQSVQRNCYALAVDQHGNFILQHILDNGSVEQADVVQKFVCSRVLELSQHKFGSHLVEKCLTSATKAQASNIVQQLLHPTGPNATYFEKTVALKAQSDNGDNYPRENQISSALLLLSKDPYANFVVQRAFDQSSGEERAMIAGEIRKSADVLSRFTYGRHILSHINRTDN